MRIATIILTALMIWSIPAPAAAKRWPCDPDWKKYCKDVDKGGGRIITCLRRHHTEISGSCRRALALSNRHLKMGAGKNAAGPRSATATAEAAEATGAAEAKPEATPARRGKAASGPRFGEVCKADVVTFCTGVRRGHGRVIRCLREHTSELAPACQEAIAALAKPKQPKQE